MVVDGRAVDRTRFAEFSNAWREPGYTQKGYDEALDLSNRGQVFHVGNFIVFRGSVYEVPRGTLQNENNFSVSITRSEGGERNSYVLNFNRLENGKLRCTTERAEAPDRRPVTGDTGLRITDVPGPRPPEPDTDWRPDRAFRGGNDLPRTPVIRREVPIVGNPVTTGSVRIEGVLSGGLTTIRNENGRSLSCLYSNTNGGTVLMFDNMAVTLQDGVPAGGGTTKYYFVRPGTGEVHSISVSPVKQGLNYVDTYSISREPGVTLTPRR